MPVWSLSSWITPVPWCDFPELLIEILTLSLLPQKWVCRNFCSSLNLTPYFPILCIFKICQCLEVGGQLVSEVLQVSTSITSSVGVSYRSSLYTLGMSLIRHTIYKYFVIVCGLCFHVSWWCPLKHRCFSFLWSPTYQSLTTGPFGVTSLSRLPPPPPPP